MEMEPDLLDFFRQIYLSPIGQAIIIAVVTAVIAKILAPRGSLLWAVSHQHFYKMPNIGGDGTFPVVTQQVWFQNTGRLPIEGVEIVLNWKPQHFEIWDPRDWEGGVLPDGRYVIRIKSLNPTEYFTVSMIDTINDLPRIISVRWRGGVGKNVQMGPQRIFPKHINLMILFIMFVGIVSILFIILRLLINYLG